MSFCPIRDLPLEILDLSYQCTVDLTGCHLDENVQRRLEEAVSAAGYGGPSFRLNEDTGTRPGADDYNQAL